MPNRVINAISKCVKTQPPKIVTANANTATDVLPSLESVGGEYVGRYIFNAGAANAYYAFGCDCDINSKIYHAWIVPGQQLDVSNTGERVSCMSTSALVIATTVMENKDVVNQDNIRPA